MSKSKDSFGLDDLESIDVETCTPVSKTNTRGSKQAKPPVAKKATVPTVKKRKPECEPATEDFEFLSFNELCPKIMDLQTNAKKGVEKIFAEHSLLDKQLEEEKSKTKTQAALATHRGQQCQRLEAKVFVLEKEIKDLQEGLEQERAQTLRGLQMSALKSVFQAKVKMAEEAAGPNFSISSWDIDAWKAKISKLEGVVGESSGTGEAIVAEEHAIKIPEVATVGNEGINA